MAIGILVGLGYWILARQYDLAEVEKMSGGTVYFDAKGRELPSMGGQQRRMISYEELPEDLVLALLAREDSRFMEHFGVDFRGVARAMVKNIKTQEFSEGASTLSMQLTRNTYDLRAKSIHRKLLEAVVTLRLERRYSKSEIITHYLNRVYFGSGCYGIEEAARTYFGRSVSELNPGECCLLVGILRGPHIFSPFRDLEAALAQRDQVIGRLVAVGAVDEDEKQTWLGYPIRLLSVESRAVERSYGLQWVRNELNEVVGDNELVHKQLRVNTSLDRDAQARLDEGLARVFHEIEMTEAWSHPARARGDRTGFVQCAAIWLNPQSGEIKAIVGGRNPEEDYFNRALLARRDLGRAYAAIVNAAVVEKGELIIRGNPVASGRLVGPAEVARISKRLRLATERRDEDLYRGAISASPVEFAKAMATLAAQGKRPELHVVKELHDKDGELLLRTEHSSHSAISRGAAETALQFWPFQPFDELLEQNDGARSSKKPEVFLVEESFGGRDVWCVAMVGTDDLCVVWSGFDEPKKIELIDLLKDRLAKSLMKIIANH